MAEGKIDPRATMAAAILNAILDCNQVGDGSFVMDSEAVRQSLVTALATILEADPRLKTPKDMREASDLIAKELRLQLRSTREHFERTGSRAWDAQIVAVQ